MPSTQKIDFDRFARFLLGLGGILAGLWLLDYLSAVLLPFFIAWLVAYLLDPLIRFAQRWIRHRGLAVGSTLLFVLLITLTITVLVIPPLFRELIAFKDLLSGYVNSLTLPDWLPGDLVQSGEAFLANYDFEALLEKEGIGEQVLSILGMGWSAISGLTGALLGLFSLVTFFLYLVFILLDYEKISTGWPKLVPEKRREAVVKVFKDVEAGMNRYFKGQALIVFWVSILFSLGFWIAGVPLPLALGIFVGLLNFIPYMQLIGLVPVTFVVVVDALQSNESVWLPLLFVLIVFAVVQIIQDAVLTPRIMGKVSGLNPAILLLSLSIWGALLGMVGLIIAIPLTTLLTSYYQSFLERT